MAGDGILERLGWHRRTEDDAPAVRLERRLGVRFRSRDRLLRALTHPSYANERGLDRDYERLEFLGDSVLGLLASEWLFSEFRELSEGKLSAMKSQLVSRHSLAAHAEWLGLGEALRIGVGEERSGGRRKSSLLADSMEAVLGALYLDQGLASARRAAVELFRRTVETGGELDAGDPKMRLQESAQAEGEELPVYRLVGESGPDHEKRFQVECRLGATTGIGEGRTKKAAEQRAAAVVLAELTSE